MHEQKSSSAIGSKSRVFGAQGSEQPAADVSVGDGRRHAWTEEPETLRPGTGSQLVRALSQLPAGEASGALPLTHFHTHAGEIRAGNDMFQPRAGSVSDQ